MDDFMPNVSEQQLLDLADDFIQTASNRHSALEGIVGLLYSNYKHYTWTGIYLVQNGELKIGPYRGEPTPHETIPIGRGICGAAVKEKKTIIVPDVATDDRYLACSITTKSEIVVPIFKNDQVIGEIDIDSDIPDAFSERDKMLLEKLADSLSRLF
jgi:putative methionine-R-sulfoxide reductase with GAF domain